MVIESALEAAGAAELADPATFEATTAELAALSGWDAWAGALEAAGTAEEGAMILTGAMVTEPVGIDALAGNCMFVEYPCITTGTIGPGR